MQYAMLDLETLATSERATILTIGALKFDPHVPLTVATYADFFIKHKDDCFEAVLSKQVGRDIDFKTVMWWMEQGESAKTTAFDSNRQDWKEALTVDFPVWYLHPEPDGCFAYPATFDHMILQSAYNDLGVKNPIHYTKMLDMRTLVKLSNVPCPTLPPWLVQHNALHDCIRQVLWLQAIQAHTDLAILQTGSANAR